MCRAMQNESALTFVSWLWLLVAEVWSRTHSTPRRNMHQASICPSVDRMYLTELHSVSFGSSSAHQTEILDPRRETELRRATRA